MSQDARARKKTKKLIQIGIGCLFSGLMLYMVFKDLDIEALKRNVSVMKWGPVVPFVGLFFLHYIVRSLRWRFLLPKPVGAPVSLRKLFDALILGNLASFLLPLRLGEFVRPFVLSRWSDYRFAPSFASVVIERFFDLSAVLVSFAVIVPHLHDFPSWATAGAYSLGGLAGGLLLFLVCGALWPDFLRMLVSRGVALLPRSFSQTFESFLFDLIDGVAVIRTPSRIVSILVLTATVWFSTFLQFYVMLELFPYHQSMLLAVTVAVFVALAIAIPSVPGFIGVFQGGCVAATGLFGYPYEAAVVYSLVIHVLSYLLFIGLGFWLLAVHDLSLFELKRAVELDDAPGT
jgi:uncharacterized protein (TIRG00374 family)